VASLAKYTLFYSCTCNSFELLEENRVRIFGDRVNLVENDTKITLVNKNCDNIITFSVKSAHTRRTWQHARDANS